MKIALVVPDNVVGVDGVFRSVDLSPLLGVHAVHFDTAAGQGEVEGNAGNKLITDFSPFQKYYDAWAAAAAPAPLTLEQAKAAANAPILSQLARLDAARNRAVMDHLLGTPLITVNGVSMAPLQRVKDVEAQSQLQRAKLK